MISLSFIVLRLTALKASASTPTRMRAPRKYAGYTIDNPSVTTPWVYDLCGAPKLTIHPKLTRRAHPCAFSVRPRSPATIVFDSDMWRCTTSDTAHIVLTDGCNRTISNHHLPTPIVVAKVTTN